MSNNKEVDFIFYRTDDGTVNAQLIVEDESVWTTQKTIGRIFGVEANTINYHLKEIYKAKELPESSTTRKIRVVQNEGGRNVERDLDFYNLDVIIAVGYRVNSYEATQFRIWATNVLKEYLIKGFAMDDERLKQSKKIFGKDYFDELLVRIKEIRASERRFYQKITDIYSQCSIDYDAKAPISQVFFSTVQNKLEFAITHHTAAEIIRKRANADSPNMGLTTWNSAPNGKILKTDVKIAKNYLTKEEIDELNSIVVMYLDFAELQAKRNRGMKMADWVEKLDAFLKFNEYDILKDAGRMRKDVAEKFACNEYEKFRKIQDAAFKSDFDKIAETIRISGQLPNEAFTKSREINEAPLSDFDNKLKQALDYNPKQEKKKSE
ncbi:MAG: virulence RhuM family protein [Chitinophagaceae bacterium]